MHLHEKPLDCNIQAFHFSTFSFENLPNWEILPFLPHTFPYYGYTSVLYTQKPLTAFLLGLPLNSWFLQFLTFNQEFYENFILAAFSIVPFQYNPFGTKYVVGNHNRHHATTYFSYYLPSAIGKGTIWILMKFLHCWTSQRKLYRSGFVL